MKGFIITIAVLAILYYLYEHFIIVVDSDIQVIDQAVNLAAGKAVLPATFRVKDLLTQASTDQQLVIRIKTQFQ